MTKHHGETTLAALLKKQREDKLRKDPPDEIRHLRKEVARLERELCKRKSNSGQIIEAVNGVLDAAHKYPPPVVSYRSAKKPLVASPVTHCIHITDWHIGKTVAPKAIEKFGEFNHAIAVRRVNRLLKGVIDKTNVQRMGYRCDEAHVIGSADWINGSIHEENILTNQYPNPDCAFRAGMLLGAFLTGLAPHFRTVKCDLITAGNHDRLTKKSQYEEGGVNSWGYVACRFAEASVSHCPNIKLTVHTALGEVVNVCGRRYLLFHGDDMGGTWGISYYGVDRKLAKEALARMNMPADTHFHMMVFGHLHASCNMLKWQIGGSLPGTDALDHKKGREAAPHQTSWFVHPKHGEFDWNRWWL